MDRSSSSASADSSSCSRSLSINRKASLKTSKNGKKPLDFTARKELKRVIEKKFRMRYTSLQMAYEQRLEALANRVQEAVNQVLQDATIHCLQENALTNEFTSARLGEIVHEYFHGEQERYIKAMSDQIAWQASDLREAQQKLRVVQRRESDAQRQRKSIQRDLQTLHHELNVRRQELQEHEKRETECKTRCEVLLEERDTTRKEVEMLKQRMQTIDTLQEEHEALKKKLLRDSSKAQSARIEMERSLKEMQEAKNRLELDKHASEQEVTHLKHLLSLSESKTREVSQAMHQLHKADYPTKLARLESELMHHEQMAALVKKEHQDLKKRYEEFGVQVEQYMHEQSQEKAALVLKGEEQIKQLQTQLDAIEREAQDERKAKQSEVMRAMDQLEFRQEALVKAEKKIVLLEERLAMADSQQVDAKLRHEKQVAGLEKDIVQWRHALEKEQEKARSLQGLVKETKDRYELKIASLQDALSRRAHQGVQEKELEARTRWQNEFVAKQDAQLEKLKEKYDKALANQQTELLRARQMTLEASSTAAAQWEKATITQKQEEEHRALQMAQKHMQREFDEREKRLEEREKRLEEYEKRLEEREKSMVVSEMVDERRRQKEAKKASTLTSASKASSVVGLNMTAADDDEAGNAQDSGSAVGQARSANCCRNEKVVVRGRCEQKEDDESIPFAQHIAELQAKEAQVALQAEERVRKLMQEFQERKESEYRTAMVSVRKGIQKLEVALEEARAEKKRIEEQLLNERQAFVRLKTEYEEANDAKRTVVQRLEETNENLGRLRTVVRDLQGKCQSLEEQCKVAVAHKEKSDAMSARVHEENKRLYEQLARATEAAAHLECSFDTSVESSEQSKKELLARVVELEDQIKAREEQFEAQMTAIEKDKTSELCSVSAQYDSHLRKLQETINEAQRRRLQEETKGTQMEVSVRELTSANESLQRTVDHMKAESLKQRKELTDLARMHKNLTESMNQQANDAAKAIEEEQGKRIAAERRALASLKATERIKLERERCLKMCRQGLAQLAREWEELCKDVRSEMDVGWQQLQAKLTSGSFEWSKRADGLLHEADVVWRRKAKDDKRKWKHRLAQANKEMDGLLSSQRVSDQSKYDQLVKRLEMKSQELEEAETRVNALMASKTTLEDTVQKLEDEQKLQLVELSHQEEHLSAAQAAIAKEVEEKNRVKVQLQTQTMMCETYRGFAASLAQRGGMDLSASLRSDEEQSAWNVHHLSEALTKLTTRLQETQAQAIEKAIAEATASTKEGVSVPLTSELDAAKKALEFLWAEATCQANDSEYDGHLPWYLRAVKAVKKEREAHEQLVSVLRMEVAAKEAEKKARNERKLKWQEANNSLRFEKDTLLREMELLQQTLQKRKEHELQELRAECDVRIEQLKQRHDRAMMASDQDYEVAMNQLRDMLEAERRSSSHVKNELIELRMRVERTEEELKEAQQKLGKETEELRESANKWKRKAKLAMKTGGVVTSSKAAMTMSSSSHGTEEDSDASYRKMHPSSRRVSNAMADLSSLMEQSLVSIRQESLIPPTSHHHHR